MKYPHISKRNFLVGFLIAGSVALSLLYLSKHLSEHLFPTLKITLQITARIDRTDSQKILWSPDGRYIAFDGRPPRSRTTNFEITVWDNVEKRIVATTPRAFTGNYFSMGFVPESLEIAFPVPTKNGAQEKTPLVFGTGGPKQVFVYLKDLTRAPMPMRTSRAISP